MTLEAQPGPAVDETPTALRLQILATEHWSLLASRSLAWNESFSRAAMFLSAVASAIVALALVAQASEFGQGFRLFALVILPVVLFIGIGTLLRLRSANYHDAICVLGMNRIRGAYLELAPELRPYFVMGVHDDRAGMLQTMAAGPSWPLPAQMMASTPNVIAALNSMLAAAIVALLAIQLGVSSIAAIGVGAIAFVAALFTHLWFARRVIARNFSGYEPLFPSA